MALSALIRAIDAREQFPIDALTNSARPRDRAYVVSHCGALPVIAVTCSKGRLVTDFTTRLAFMCHGFFSAYNEI